MKKYFGLISFALFLPFVVSCTSHEQPAESAFERVKQEKMMTLDSAARNEETAQTILPVAAENNPIEQTTWEIYKAETEKKIDLNNKAIRKIKLLPDLSVGMFMKTNMLEADNLNLEVLLDSSDRLEKEAQEVFKSKMDSDLLYISKEIDELMLKYNDRL